MHPNNAEKNIKLNVSYFSEKIFMEIKYPE